MSDFVRRQWDLYRNVAVPPGVPQDEVNQLRRTFYAGVEAALNMQKALAALNKEEAIIGLQEIFREVHRFENDSERGGVYRIDA